MKKQARWTLSLSIGAIILSSVSLYLSSISNNRTIEIQELQTRPWLTITVVKNKETGYYYDIEKTDGYVSKTLELEIENTGNTPANNIKITDFKYTKNLNTNNENLSSELHNIILGQGKKYGVTLTIRFKHKNLTDNELDKLIKNRLELTYIVEYQGLSNPNEIYSTKTTFEIFRDKVSLINDSEFK